MFLWLQFDHLNTLFLLTHGHFLALLLRVVLLHHLHPQLALHNLLLLLPDCWLVICQVDTVDSYSMLLSAVIMRGVNVL